MIEEEEIQRALDWLVQNSNKAAKARAERLFLEEFRKSLKSTLMKESKEETIAGQERDAYAHPKYVEHLQLLKYAVTDDERYKWLLTAAEVKIEVWRSEQANARAQGKVG